MRVRRVRRTTAGAALAVGLLAAGASIAVAGPPAGSVAISPVATDGPYDQADVVLAGAATELVYAQTALRVAPEAGPSTRLGTTNYARAIDGTTVSLGDAMSGEDYWRTDGHLVVSSSEATVARTVFWWDLDDSTSGTTAMPDSAILVGPVDGGWDYLLSGALYHQTTAGASTLVATLPTGLTTAHATYGPDGIVFVEGTVVDYMSYADPTTFVALDNDDPDTQFGLRCDTASKAAVVCDVGTTEGGASGTKTVNYGYLRMPLDGGNAAIYDSPCYSTVVLTSQETGWHCSTLVTASAGGGAATTAAFTLAEPAVSAYGDFVGVSGDGTTIESVADASRTPTVLVAPSPSPVAASTFTLSAGRVAWTDDDLSEAQVTPTPAVELQTQPVTAVSGALTLGTPTVTATITGADAPLSTVSTSAGTTVYQTTAALSGQTVLAYTILNATGSRTIAPAKDSFLRGVSGNRLLFANTGDSNTVSVYDVDTGASTTVLTKVPPSMSLWGRYLTYVSGKTGAVVRKNVVTGATETVAPAISDKSVYATTVSEWGDEIGWERFRPISAHGTTSLASFRNLAGSHSVVDLGTGQDLVAMTSNGVLLQDNSATATDTATATQLAAGPYDLRGYGTGATAHQVLPAGTTYGTGAVDAAAPQVDSSVIAWLNDAGVVSAAPLKAVPDAPRSLGAGVAPPTLTTQGAGAWTFSLPFSAALTSCTLRIGDGARTLRTLPCDPSQMSAGDALVRWDRRDSKGNVVPAGNVIWTLQARNGDGPAVTVGGGGTKIAGAIAIGRTATLTLDPHRSVVRPHAHHRRRRHLHLRGTLTIDGGRAHHLAVQIYRRAKGRAGYHLIHKVHTTEDGRFHFTTKPHRTSRYRAVFTGTVGDRPTASRTVRVTVKR